MNAPQDFSAVLEQLPIQSIRPSPFKAQTIRRQHFSSAKMLELAASISANGVLQPILVRPMPISATVRYEIVAGERRFIAADRAGLAHIPATVREMTDAQVLEAQLVENIQREGLHVLEEAEGYAELMKVGDLTAEQIGDKIGKSRSYVYARLKLLDLIPAAREALNSGELDASKALILARIKGEKMQTRALKLVKDMAHGYSYRRLIEKLRDDCMIPISQAPWLPDRDTLHEAKGGAPIQHCSTCPTRSCNDPELQAEIGDDKDVCVDRACFDLKTKLHFARLRHEFEAEGREVITGPAAKAVLPERWSAVRDGMVRLDAEVGTIEFDDAPERGENESDEDFNARWEQWDIASDNFVRPTFAEVVGTLPDSKLVEIRAGQYVQMAPAASVAKALEAKGIEVPAELKQKRKKASGISDGGNGLADPEREARERAEAAKEEERQKVETEFRRRLLKLIHTKWKPPMKRQDFNHIAEAMLEGAENTDAFDEIYGHGRPDVAKMKEADLQRWMVIYSINHDCDEWAIRRGGKASALLDYATRLKIDVKKLRAEVVKDLKPVSAPPAEEETATKAKKKAVKK